MEIVIGRLYPTGKELPYSYHEEFSGNINAGDYEKGKDS